MAYLPANSCAACGEPAVAPTQAVSRWYGSVSWLLLLVLPKCPFCVVAYTSSMAICGAPSITHHHTDWGAWLAIGLAVICIGTIARNYRGSGTRTAILIAIAGLICLLAGLFLPNAMSAYYAGASLLFLSSFYNGRGYRIVSHWSFISRHSSLEQSLFPMTNDSEAK
jgi:hypothetical protein